ncbi:Uncharacterised protein [uncultured Roseburia sp.]|uniref:Uncharacterized protein n=1 Tax=Brotonthovivens ammoniilytica TaxID=2981725 RepID=A0ABT2TJ92_9FIRM|nr:hypothetical protein [Brotonthovivens ammoniilytica]MCU6762283.1 hypothetical protein [Brotonthovivens ammoniilytica]SCI61224.1 Uncharacterised protein [uncultured Roseburia sp.]
MPLKVNLKWDRSKESIIRKKNGGKDGMLFLANEAVLLMKPYMTSLDSGGVPEVQIDVAEKSGKITYSGPNIRNQYKGEDIPLGYETEDESKLPEWKFPVSKISALQDSIFSQPLATSGWDKAMLTARKEDLLKVYEIYLKGRS